MELSALLDAGFRIGGAMIKVNRKIEGKLNLPDRDKMRKMGLGAVDIIRERTTIQNRDVTGKRFKPYTPEYKEYKAKVRPGFKGVDLQLTGKMMQNLKLKDISNDKAVVGFSGIHAVKAFYNDKLRPFFALSKSEFKKLLGIVFRK